MRRRPLGAVVATAALACILAATLTPTPGARPVAGSALCLVCGDYGGVDFLLNVLLFVPLGAGLWLAGAPLGAVALAALVTTLAIETLQLELIAGRDASLGDVVSNALGGTAGAWLAARWRRLAAPDARTAARLAVAGAAAWLLVAAGTARSVALWSPGQVALYRRSPFGRTWGWFPGRVLLVRAAGAAVAPGDGDGDGRYAVTGRVPPGGPLALHATVVAAGPTRVRAAIATVMGSEREAVAVLGQHGRDLAFDVRTGASLARLRTPGIGLGDLFAPRDERGAGGGRPVAGDTLRVDAEYTRARLRLTARWRGGGAVRTAALHPFVGWSYLLPWEYRYGGEAGLLSALWAGGLLAPAAYWAGRAARRRARRGALAVAGAVGGAALVAPLTGVAAPPAVVWGGVALGVAAGGLAGWALARPDRPGAAGR